MPQFSIWDNACNERFYSLGGTEAEPMSATEECSIGYVDPESRVPDETCRLLRWSAQSPWSYHRWRRLSSPPMLISSRQRSMGRRLGNSSAWNNDTSTFQDWLYHVEVDGEVIDYQWPDTETIIDESFFTPGQHTVRVRAVNRFGTSEWSQPLTFSATQAVL